MRRRLLGVLIALSLALNVAFAGTWAAQRLAAGDSGRLQEKAALHGEPAVWCPLHRELGVSAQQWERIEPLLRAFQERVQALCRQLGQERDQMIALLSAPEVDQDAVRSQQQRILEGHGRMQDMVVEHLLAEKAVLDSVQQAKLFSLVSQHASCAAGGPPMMGAGMRRGGAAGSPSQPPAGGDAGR